MSASESSIDREVSETFRLTEEDRVDILSQVHITDSLQPESESLQSDAQQKLEVLRKKELTLQLHATTLAEYIKTRRIPRGLRVNLTPNLLSDDSDFVKQWYGLCNAFSADLMYLTIKHLNEKISKLQADIIEAESEVKAHTSSDKFQELTSALNDTLLKLKENILKTKRRKFERDAKDYHNDLVYSWNKKKSKQGPSQAGRRKQTRENLVPQATDTNTDSSDSTESDNKTKRSFLGKGGTRKEGPGETSHQPPQQRPATRSWTTRGRGRNYNRR